MLWNVDIRQHITVIGLTHARAWHGSKGPGHTDQCSPGAPKSLPGAKWLRFQRKPQPIQQMVIVGQLWSPQVTPLNEDGHSVASTA